MFTDLSDTIYELRHFIFFALLVGTLCFVLVTVFNRKLAFLKKRIKFYGIFFDLSGVGQHCLALMFLRFLFVLYCAIFIPEMEGMHLLFLLLVTSGIFLFHRQLYFFLTEVFFSFLLYGALSVEYLLKAYQMQVRFEWSIALILFGFASFVVLYALSMFIKGVRLIISNPKGAHFYVETERKD